MNFMIAGRMYKNMYSACIVFVYTVVSINTGPGESFEIDASLWWQYIDVWWVLHNWGIIDTAILPPPSSNYPSPYDSIVAGIVPPMLPPVRTAAPSPKRITDMHVRVDAGKEQQKPDAHWRSRASILNDSSIPLFTETAPWRQDNKRPRRA